MPVRSRAGFTWLELATTVMLLVALLAVAAEMAEFVKTNKREQLTRERIAQLQALLPRASRDELPRFDGRAADAHATALASTLGLNTGAIRDAWGMPIVLADPENRDLGLPPTGDPYLISAGPDRNYATRGDNLYGYDEVSN
ncbi:MAG: hypothetical protein AAGD32_12195 [Planctomycetota bacterium]